MIKAAPRLIGNTASFVCVDPTEALKAAGIKSDEIAKARSDVAVCAPRALKSKS